MLHRTRNNTAGAALLAAAALVAATPALAHPHVWVTVRDSIVFENGKVTGVEHRWTFDEMYSVMAIEGLDTNQDGNYTREELTELAQTNIDGLKDFDYFTFATLADQKLTFSSPRDFWIEYKDKQLTLHFFLPLSAPQAPAAPAMTLRVTDPSFYIAFSFAKDNAIATKGAPDACTAILVPETMSNDQQALSTTFATQLAPIGEGITGAISIACAK